MLEEKKQMLKIEEKNYTNTVDDDIEIDYEENVSEKENVSMQITLKKNNIKTEGFNINKVTNNSHFDIKKCENGKFLVKLNNEDGKYLLTGISNETLYFISNNTPAKYYDDSNDGQEDDSEIEIPENAKVVKNDCISNLCKKISICCTNCLKNCFCRGNNESK